MKTHPNYPKRGHDTAILIRSLIVAIIMLAILLIVTGCTSAPPPRAIIAPPTIITAVDTAPTEEAARKLDEATEKVTAATRNATAANDKAISTSVHLRAAMERTRILSEGQDLLREAWADAEELAAQLGNDLLATQNALSETMTESHGLREAVKSLASEVSALKASAAVNKMATEAITAENTTLRQQAEQGNTARDQLINTRANLKTAQAQNAKLWPWVIGLGIGCIILAISSVYLAIKP